MRFRIGGIPNSPDFQPEAPWKALREPSVWVAQIVAVPIGLMVSVVLGILWAVFTPLPGIPRQISVISFFLAFAGITIVHELLHAVVHPGQGRSPRTILGVWPAKMLFYAHYDGELTRNRFVAILIAPFLGISVLPLVLAVFLQISSGWMAFVSIFNALLACVDLLGVMILLKHLPADAITRNQGWRTYWRQGSCIPVRDAE